MKRNIDMKEVSDGRFYGLRDMVKAGCGDCQGCCDAAVTWVPVSCWILMISSA